MQRTWWILLPLAAGLAAFVPGIGWGLPSRDADLTLFGDRPPFTGRQILDLAGGWDTDTAVAADRDRDPLSPAGDAILLNGDDRAIAQIVRRYRLYSRQPDEMITFRALSQIKPGAGKFDPKLYQYGGLWTYPVGGLLMLGSKLGVVHVTGDVTHYLDHPDDFARFYVVARAYSAAWGLLGVVAVFVLIRQIVGRQGNFSAAIGASLFAILPVTITMAHEAKPHLAGAALMLWATSTALRYLQSSSNRSAVIVGLLAGAAVAMVPTTLPIVLILPAAVLLVARASSPWPATPIASATVVDQNTPSGNELKARATGVRHLLLMGFAAFVVYAVTNPYVLINAILEPSLLSSSAGNTAAMYSIRSLGSGFLNTTKLTAEAAGIVLAIAGVIAWLSLHFSPTAMRHRLILLALPAVCTFGLFALFAAGKPGEYGRFLLFPAAALVIGLCVALHGLPSRWSRLSLVAFGLIALWPASIYWEKFSSHPADRAAWAAQFQHWKGQTIATTAEPAPYCLPPVNLFDNRLLLVRDVRQPPPEVTLFVRSVDRHGKTPGPTGFWLDSQKEKFKPEPAPISWARKPVEVWEMQR